MGRGGGPPAPFPDAAVLPLPQALAPPGTAPRLPPGSTPQEIERRMTYATLGTSAPQKQGLSRRFPLPQAHAESQGDKKILPSTSKNVVLGLRPAAGPAKRKTPVENKARMATPPSGALGPLLFLPAPHRPPPAILLKVLVTCLRDRPPGNAHPRAAPYVAGRGHATSQGTTRSCSVTGYAVSAGAMMRPGATGNPGWAARKARNPLASRAVGWLFALISMG